MSARLDLAASVETGRKAEGDEQRQYKCTYNYLVSESRSAPVPVKAGDPIYLSVTAGMTVIVQPIHEVGFASADGRWWISDVIYMEGGARNPQVPTLFQVADVDSGEVLWVNACLVTHIVPRL